MTRAMGKPLVSIVIPTRNSQEMIERCLSSIKQQTFSNIEIIIVDNYSKDETVNIAQRYDAKVLLMNAERSAARNYGVANADEKTRFILLLDSDMELSPDVVEECVKACFKLNADATIIPETSISPNNNMLSKCRTLEKELLEYSNTFVEIPRFFKREVYYEIGGYDESLVFGESTEFNLRLKNADYKIIRIRAKAFHYEGRLSWRNYQLEECYYGKTLPYLLRRNFSAFAYRHSPVSQSLFSRRNVKLMFKYPSYLPTLALMEIVKYGAFCAGFLCYLADA